MMNPVDIQHLAQLLKDEDNDSSSSEDDLPKARFGVMGPGDIGKCTKMKINGNDADFPVKNEISDDPKSIWNLSEVHEVPFSDDSLWDPRDKPKYNITYKQALKPEDIYLQMSNKNPTTASCEWLVITVMMEGECKSDIDCNITEQYLDIRSPKYRLNLLLPHPIDPNAATAEWNCSSNQLVICLQMNRELDFINF